MQFSFIEIAFLILCAVLPASLLLLKFINKKNSIYSKFEKTWKLSYVDNIDNIQVRAGYSILMIDKTIIDDQVINIGTQIASMSTPHINQINLNQHYKFYHSYLDKRWDMAIVIAKSMKTAWNGEMKNYYDNMIARCNYYKKNPPAPGWNGIYNKV